jgi:hypothetical protein
MVSCRREDQRLAPRGAIDFLILVVYNPGIMVMITINATQSLGIFPKRQFEKDPSGQYLPTDLGGAKEWLPGNPLAISGICRGYACRRSTASTRHSNGEPIVAPC